MQRYTIAILVHNQFGVLNRVTSMFRRRQFNIACLTVSETESPETSRITVLFDGDDRAKQQLVAQLGKLPDVVSIKEFEPDQAISAELLLIKMENNPETRDEILDAARVFGVQVVDYSRHSIVMRMTDDSRRIDNFIDLMRDFDILEICRTGVVSLERGSTVMRKQGIM
ncbi:MAG: acetolactate synthase small subunit [Coriobacteriales bacterium]|nr:acetolactate synthase small subunit [Coriobacteriales bacterium]